MYPEQLRIADILNDLGVATQEAGKFDESLRHYQEAKEILVNNGRNSHFSCTKEHWKKLFGTYTVPFSFSIFKKCSRQSRHDHDFGRSLLHCMQGDG